MSSDMVNRPSKSRRYSLYMTFIYATRVLKRNLRVFYKLYKTNLVINFIEPMLYLFAFGLGLGGFIAEIDGLPYINYIAPGMVAFSGLFAAAFECLYGTYTRMEYQKTFEGILATPVNADGVAIGEILYGATKAVIFSVIIIIVVYAFRLIPTPYLPLALPFIFIAAIVFGSLSIIVTSFVRGIETFNYYVTLVISPMMLMSGIFFPLSGVLAKVAAISPFYHTARICQLLAAGNIAQVWKHGAVLLGMAIVLCYISVRLMRRRLEV